MSVLQSSQRTDQHLVLFWYSNQVGDIVHNQNGVGSEHTTKIISGRTKITFDDDRPEQELIAGEEIVLPIRVGYTFKVLEAPGEIHCFYPLGEPANEVVPLELDRATPRIWETHAVPKVEDWDNLKIGKAWI